MLSIRKTGRKETAGRPNRRWNNNFKWIVKKLTGIKYVAETCSPVVGFSDHRSKAIVFHKWRENYLTS
jgi:hypothetical protein